MNTITARKRRPCYFGVSPGPVGKDGDIARYVWDFGDSSEPVTTPAAQTTHIYASPGTYRVKVAMVEAGKRRASQEWLAVITDYPELPGTPLNMWVGPCIYPQYRRYLIANHMWAADTLSPWECLDKVIEEHLGNLACFWHPNVHSYQSMAWWCGESHPPAPDWNAKRHIEPSELDDVETRRGRGVREWNAAARSQGVATMTIYCGPHFAPGQLQELVRESGPLFLGSNMGEANQFLYMPEIQEQVEKMAGRSYQGADLKSAKEALVRWLHDVKVAPEKAKGFSSVFCTAGAILCDYEMEAGFDTVMVEQYAVGGEHLNLACAASRGAAKKWGAPWWGAWHAHEWYGPCERYADPLKYTSVEVGMKLGYLAGSCAQILESGTWCLQHFGRPDSPQRDGPQNGKHEPDGCWVDVPPTKYPQSQGTPFKASVLADCFNKDGALWPLTDAYLDSFAWDSPWPTAYRNAMSRFYRWLREHPRPEQPPEARIGVAYGVYEGFNGVMRDEWWPGQYVLAQYRLAKRDPRWRFGEPERGWLRLLEALSPLPQGVAGGELNRWFSGSPYGQFDVVGVERNCSAGYLRANYDVLVFCGWNTMTADLYQTLKQYVSEGGHLVMAAAHLSASLQRDYDTYTAGQLYNGGDVRDLFGVTIDNFDRTVSSAAFGAGETLYAWPSGTFTVGHALPLARIGPVSPAVRTAAFADGDPDKPLVIEHSLGKGKAYLSLTHAYPGGLDREFVVPFYKAIGRNERGPIYIVEPGTGDAGENAERIVFSVYPETGKIMLLNIDMVCARRVELQVEDASGRWSRVLEFEPAEMKEVGYSAPAKTGL